jgi:hypothetical protein
MKWAVLIGLFAGCSNPPLRFHLQAPASDACVIHYLMSGDDHGHDLTMTLHYRVLSADEVEIGPGTFPPGAPAPKWPSGATARFHFSELGHADNWTFSAPPELPAEELAAWRNVLEQRYAFGVGLVEFPTESRKSWEQRERQGKYQAVRRYNRSSQSDERARVWMGEETTLDGENQPSEQIYGEVTYDLKRPLPIGGGITIERNDPNGSPIKIRYEYGN